MTKVYNTDTGTLKSIRDLTERLNTKEKELIVANKRFHILFDHAPIGIIITSNRTIMNANKFMYKTLGYTSEDLIGCCTRILYDTEETYERVGELLKLHDEFTCSVNMKHKDGIIKEYTLKVSKISTDENVASIYIEMRE